jgi:hypothetical protein
MAETEREADPPSREAESPRQNQPVESESREPEQPIDADDDHAPTDDGYASDSVSATSTSMASSIRDYRFENSRRYHRFKEGLYQFPNDVPEQEREDMKHTVAVHLLGGKLHNAPLKNPQKIIDIGTGTGSWAIDSLLPNNLVFMNPCQHGRANSLNQWATSIPPPKSLALI